jgi:hypothetical protein
MTEENEKNVTVTVRMPITMSREFKAWCAINGIKISDAVASAIAEYISKSPKQ